MRLDGEGASHFTQRAASFNATTGLLEMPQLPALGASHGMTRGYLERLAFLSPRAVGCRSL